VQLTDRIREHQFRTLKALRSLVPIGSCQTSKSFVFFVLPHNQSPHSRNCTAGSNSIVHNPKRHAARARALQGRKQALRHDGVEQRLQPGGERSYELEDQV